MLVFQPQGQWARCARELSGVTRRTRNCRPFSTRLSSWHRVEWWRFVEVPLGLRAGPAAPCSTPRTRSKAADASVWAGLWLRLDSEAEARHLLIMTARDSTAGDHQMRESHNARSDAAKKIKGQVRERVCARGWPHASCANRFNSDRCAAASPRAKTMDR